MADDLGAAYADKKIQTLERKLKKEYKQAQKDIAEKLKNFVEAADAKDQIMLGKVASGKITQDEYDHWRQGKVFFGQNWKAQQDNIAKVLADTNAVATAMINREMPDVFAFNGNYTAFEFEKGFGVNFGFDLYNEKAVERLLRDNPKILPKKHLDKSKDIPWNMRNIRSQITQGILQGESIPKIAKRLSEAVPESNRKQMVMHARTAMTSAQNGGRMERFKEAEDLGIKFVKLWRCTLDSRTRETHRDLDGKTAKPDDPFEIDGQKIMFPGDPDAAPALVYNCRCTMQTELEDYPAHFKRSAYKEWVDENGEFHRESYITDSTTYREWEKGKIADGNTIKTPEKIQPKAEVIPEAKKPEPLRELSRIKATMDEDDYKEFHALVSGNEYVEDLYDKFEDKVGVHRQKNGGTYYPNLGKLEYDFAKEDRFSTLSHEFGHCFDDKARGEFAVNYDEIDKLNKAVSEGWGIKREPFKKTPSQCDEYLQAIRKDAEQLKISITQKWTRDELNGDDASAGVQDLCDGLFATQDSTQYHLKWGHGNKYYNRKYNNQIKGMAEKEVQKAYKEMGFDAGSQKKVKEITRIYEASSELWANQVAALTTQSEAVFYMENYCPNSFSVIKRLLKERK